MHKVEFQNVSKAYGRVQALRSVTAGIPTGTICGLLGRNGAGKTTLLNILTNRIFADQGQALVDGQPAVENEAAQAGIFYMTEKTLYPGELSVQEVFDLTRTFYPGFDREAAAALAKRFQLVTKKTIGALSTGYRSIFKLVLALASNAPLLVFDEPVLGLDANHRDLFYRELAGRFDPQRQTVILSTHLIEEAAGMLEEVIILKEGQVLLAQPVEAILQLAYSVSGSQENVDAFTAGKKVLREESLGRYKMATIYQPRNGADQAALAALDLELSPVRLQELIVRLTD